MYPSHGRQSGAVAFLSTAGGGTEVSLTLTFDPQGLVANVGDILGFVERRVTGDLQRFKAFIESRETPTGQWARRDPLTRA